jgi:hypothetical protein
MYCNRYHDLKPNIGSPGILNFSGPGYLAPVGFVDSVNRAANRTT